MTSLKSMTTKFHGIIQLFVNKKIKCNVVIEQVKHERLLLKKKFLISVNMKKAPSIGKIAVKLTPKTVQHQLIRSECTKKQNKRILFTLMRIINNKKEYAYGKTKAGLLLFKKLIPTENKLLSGIDLIGVLKVIITNKISVVQHSMTNWKMYPPFNVQKRQYHRTMMSYYLRSISNKNEVHNHNLGDEISSIGADECTKNKVCIQKAEAETSVGNINEKCIDVKVDDTLKSCIDECNYKSVPNMTNVFTKNVKQTGNKVHFNDMFANMNSTNDMLKPSPNMKNNMYMDYMKKLIKYNQFMLNKEKLKNANINALLGPVTNIHTQRFDKRLPDVFKPICGPSKTLKEGSKNKSEIDIVTAKLHPFHNCDLNQSNSIEPTLDMSGSKKEIAAVISRTHDKSKNQSNMLIMNKIDELGKQANSTEIRPEQFIAKHYIQNVEKMLKEDDKSMHPNNQSLNEYESPIIHLKSDPDKPIDVRIDAKAGNVLAVEGNLELNVDLEIWRTPYSSKEITETPTNQSNMVDLENSNMTSALNSGTQTLKSTEAVIVEPVKKTNEHPNVDFSKTVKQANEKIDLTELIDKSLKMKARLIKQYNLAGQSHKVNQKLSNYLNKRLDEYSKYQQKKAQFDNIDVKRDFYVTKAINGDSNAEKILSNPIGNVVTNIGVTKPMTINKDDKPSIEQRIFVSPALTNPPKNEQTHTNKIVENSNILTPDRPLQSDVTQKWVPLINKSIGHKATMAQSFTPITKMSHMTPTNDLLKQTNIQANTMTPKYTTHNVKYVYKDHVQPDQTKTAYKKSKTDKRNKLVKEMFENNSYTSTKNSSLKYKPIKPYGTLKKLRSIPNHESKLKKTKHGIDISTQSYKNLVRMVTDHSQSKWETKKIEIARRLKHNSKDNITSINSAILHNYEVKRQQDSKLKAKQTRMKDLRSKLKPMTVAAIKKKGDSDRFEMFHNRIAQENERQYERHPKAMSQNRKKATKVRLINDHNNLYSKIFGD